MDFARTFDLTQRRGNKRRSQSFYYRESSSIRASSLNHNYTFNLSITLKIALLVKQT